MNVHTRVRLIAAALLLCGVAAAVQPVSGEHPVNWPQFRGPNASGVAVRDSAPTEFGPGRGVRWKQAVPSGHSSPVIWGERVFLTAFERSSGKLELLALSAKDGAILWRHAVPAPQIEAVHEVSSAATATPAADADNVYAYFASYGIVAVDHAGRVRWSVPLPMLKTALGSGTSPVVHGDALVLNRDAIEGGHLLVLDRRTGATRWNVDYPPPTGRRAESYSTPVIWRNQVVLHRLGIVEGYDLVDGRRVWWATASTTGTSTVVVGTDTVYAATWSPFGEADQVPPLPDFATLIKESDKDGNGQIAVSELSPSLVVFSRPDVPGVPGASLPVRDMFASIDQNKDGQVNEPEWQQALGRVKGIAKEHGVVAIKPGEGDLTSTIVWREKLAVPEVPSPLLYDNRLYLIRNGGILSCLDATSGKVVYRARVGAAGPYYSSPVAANGRIYVASGEGIVAVLTSGDALKVLARNDLGEPIYATPAIAAGTLFVRTAAHLYAFH